MAMVIGPQAIDALLLGVGGRRRELQDFPILGDVWARFAEKPGEPHDLLITPTWEKPTGEVARLVARTGLADAQVGPYCRNVAYLHGLVVATLTLEDLVRVAIPATKWWDGINDKWNGVSEGGEEPGGAKGGPADERLREIIGWELKAALAEEALRGEGSVAKLVGEGDRKDYEGYLSLEIEDRQAARLGLMLGALLAAEAKAAPKRAKRPAEPPTTVKELDDELGRDAILEAGVAAIRLIIDQHDRFADRDDKMSWNGLIFQVSLNRDAMPALHESVGAIKGDAARSLFSISCKEIGWAVLDSGIDGNHPAFWDYDKIFKAQEKAAADKLAGRKPAPAGPPPNRIKATFDFRRIRAIMSVDGVDHDKLIEELAARDCKLERDQIKERLEELATDRSNGRRVNWARVRELIEHEDPLEPEHPHGTHVAGIIGAHWLKFKAEDGPKPTDPVRMNGVCPDIKLYDFRVLGSSLGDSEFAVIAALQFIRYLNDQSGYSLIHGVNMSLSIPHNVRNYACGRTQVCVEAEALTSNAVVVVAAAGNRGFQQYKLADNSMFESYAASSITDPGNAEGVITVGATHRAWPHTYGVSFFSSRGPTGDGRLKPDLLAPGEKITSCIPGGREDEMDGTSMAAPHVSGAAALLMARHQELQGQPARIKQILCDTATDLKRERSFQGHGMVDVLRAIQSI